MGPWGQLCNEMSNYCRGMNGAETGLEHGKSVRLSTKYISQDGREETNWFRKQSSTSFLEPARDLARRLSVKINGPRGEDWFLLASSLQLVLHRSKPGQETLPEISETVVFSSGRTLSLNMSVSLISKVVFTHLSYPNCFKTGAL